MKNFIFMLCSFMVLSVPITLQCQTAFVSVGANIVLPQVIHFELGSKPGYGGSLHFEAAWSSHFSGMGTVEYLHFSNSQPYQSIRLIVVPVQTGIKYYVARSTVYRKGLFFSFETGVLFTWEHYSYTFNPGATFNNSDISIAPGIGYLLGNLEINARAQYSLLQTGFSTNYFNFGLALCFFKKNSK